MGLPRDRMIIGKVSVYKGLESWIGFWFCFIRMCGRHTEVVLYARFKKVVDKLSELKYN